MSDTNLLSVGPLENLKRGWALLPFVGKRAHYWVEDTKTMPSTIGKAGRVRYYRSFCGVLGVTNHSVPALGVGNFPRCKTCQRIWDAM